MPGFSRQTSQTRVVDYEGNSKHEHPPNNIVGVSVGSHPEGVVEDKCYRVASFISGKSGLVSAAASIAMPSGCNLPNAYLVMLAMKHFQNVDQSNVIEKEKCWVRVSLDLDSAIYNV
jgi:hypothetical protein